MEHGVPDGRRAKTTPAPAHPTTPARDPRHRSNGATPAVAQPATDDPASTVPARDPRHRAYKAPDPDATPATTTHAPATPAEGELE